MPEAEALELAERLTDAAEAASLLPLPCTAPAHAWLSSTLSHLKDQSLQDADIPSLTRVVRSLAGSSVWMLVAWLRRALFVNMVILAGQVGASTGSAFVGMGIGHALDRHYCPAGGALCDDSLQRILAHEIDMDMAELVGHKRLAMACTDWPIELFNISPPCMDLHVCAEICRVQDIFQSFYFLV